MGAATDTVCGVTVAELTVAFWPAALVTVSVNVVAVVSASELLPVPEVTVPTL